MPIDLVRSGISAGVGVVDEVLESMDANAGRVKSFRTATDIGRLVIAGVGYGLQVFMPRQAKLGETLALSATPLLVKSIAKPIRATMGKATSSTAGFVSRTRAVQGEYRPVKPQTVYGTGYRSM